MLAMFKPSKLRALFTGLLLLTMVAAMACGSEATAVPSAPPPTQDIQTLVQQALQGAIPAAAEGVSAADVQAAISAAIAQAAAPAGVTASDVQAAITTALSQAAASGISEADVQQAVASAITAASGDDLTASQVEVLITDALTAAIPVEEPIVKELIKFHDASWASLWLHNGIAMYIVEKGYGYPVEEIQGTTGTMKVALPLGDLDVNMELWRMNTPEWYNEFVVEKGEVIDLAGTGANLPMAARGQVLLSGGQGFYVPTYVIKGDAERGIEATAPDLVSVFDLPQYASVFQDLEDPEKGLLINCIVDWQCHKINRAKWAAYGLNDTYNVLEPGSSAALDAAIQGAYDAGEPVLTYYWEPTALLNRLDMTRLDEPAWTQECADTLAAATEELPYASEVGCGYPFGDIHVGVYSGLLERAPEVGEFLSNMFIGSKLLGELEAWKIDNDKEWRDAAIYYVKNNGATWASWVPIDVAARVNSALAAE